MTPPPLPTKKTPTAVATKAASISSSSSSTATQPATPTSDNNNSPTPPTGRKIHITSSCNYTKPIIRLNFKNLNPKTTTSTTTSSPSYAPTALVIHQDPKDQAASYPGSSLLPVSTPAAPDLSHALLTSTSKQANKPKSAQPVVNTIKSSNSTKISNRSCSSSNISLPPDFNNARSDEIGTKDVRDPSPDTCLLHYTQPQLARSPSLSHQPSRPTKQQDQTQEPEMNCSVDGEDPFKELGLKPYSPIWLPSRTPSFEMMRQRSYSPNPRHGMTIRPSQAHDDDDVIGNDDRIILGFDLHEVFQEEDDKPNKKNLTTTVGEERQEPGSHRQYEKFGCIKKRHSSLLPDHYDDLEDHDAEEANLQMVDAKANCISMTKRPRHDHAQDQSQVSHSPPPLPYANNSNISNNHDIAESGEKMEGPSRAVRNGQSPFPHLWSDNNSNNSNHGHPYRQQPFGNLRFPSSQHLPHPHRQSKHHRSHSQQHETLQNNNFSLNRHHNLQINRPYKSRRGTFYRGNNYQHPGGLHATRDGFPPGNGGVGDEGSTRFHHEREFSGRGRKRGRGRGFGRGRGRGRESYDSVEFYNRYHFPPRQDGSHGMNPHHQHQYQQHFEDEGPLIDARLHEIANGTSTGTGTGTVSCSASASPPPPLPPQEHPTDPHPPPSSSLLSTASSSRTTLHPNLNLSHHIHASAQQNEKHSHINNSSNTRSSTSPQPIPSVPPSSKETKTTVAPLSKSTTSSTTSFPSSFPSSLRTPSSPPPPVFISHHPPSSHNSISSKSFPRSHSLSRSRSRSPSPATLASSAQIRLTRYAASEISSLAQKLTTEQTLRVQAQKQIRLLTQSLRDLEERNQLVEQNYEMLLARYSREVRK